MKKYIKPAIVEVKVDNEAILAASPNLNDVQGNGSWHARGMDWDDDEDE